MAKNFTNFLKDFSLQIWESQQISSIINGKKIMPRYIIVKLLKTNDKEKVPKSVRENDSFKAAATRLATDFLTKKMK